MLFRFSFTKGSGESSYYDREFDRLADAKVFINFMMLSFGDIDSVTLHQYLTDDSCGPIKFIGSYIFDGTRVINRDTKVVI